MINMNRKPSIAYIHGAEPLVGVGRRFKELHKRLLKDFDVTLLSLGAPTLQRENYDEGILIKSYYPVFGKLLVSNSGGAYYQYRFLHYVLSPLIVKKFSDKADIIHEEMSPLPFFTPLYVDKPVVLTVNEIRGGLNFKVFGLLGGIPYIIEKVLKHVPYDVVISVSQVTHERLKSLGIPNILIPNGVDTKKFAPAPVKEPKHYSCILMVARLINHKGIYDYLKVAEKTSKIRKDVKFLLVGKGPLEPKIRLYIKQKGLEGSILLLKNLPEEEYIKTIQNCDMYLHTNPNQEGFGLSIAEAMSCGIPVIAYNIPGVNELVNNNCGILVKPGDIDALINAILELLDNKHLREEYGRSARDTILKKYDWEKSAQMLRKVYLTLLH